MITIEKYDGTDENTRIITQQNAAFSTACAKGWHNGFEVVGIPSVEKNVAWMALVHTELVKHELVELALFFDGPTPRGKIVKLADCKLRLLDVAAACGLSVGNAVYGCTIRPSISFAHRCVAEITEALRKGETISDLLYYTVAVIEKLAFDEGFDEAMFDSIFTLKNEFNLTRPYRHGGLLI